MLNLLQASELLGMHPEAVLKCVRYSPRPGGHKLKILDQEGEPVFTRTDLEEFDKDLLIPWVKSKEESRPKIPPYFQLSLKLETLGRCAVCGELTAKEFVHIDEWSDVLHHHPRNLLCLCVKCHDGYDKEKRISKEEVLCAKRRTFSRMMRELKGKGMSKVELGDNPSIQELCRAIDVLLSENATVFFAFGPMSEYAQRVFDPEAANIWKKARKETILINNKEVYDLLVRYIGVYEHQEGFKEAASRFMAHSQSYQEFVSERHSNHREFPFPAEFREIVKEIAAK